MRGQLGSAKSKASLPGEGHPPRTALLSPSSRFSKAEVHSPRRDAFNAGETVAEICCQVLGGGASPPRGERYPLLRAHPGQPGPRSPW